MYRATLRISLAALAALAGCVHMTRPSPVARPQAGPTHTSLVSVRAPTATKVKKPLLADGLSFYDMTAAYGLKVSIDLVTGRRICRDGVNTVVVMPSRSDLTINGTTHALSRMIYWQAGVLYLPGDARALLSNTMKAVPVANVPGDSALFDGHSRHLKAWKERGKPAAARRRTSSAPLPATWRVSSRRSWRYIVIHHSATQVGGAKSFHREHAKKWQNGLGYHFVIGNGTSTGDGAIEVGTRWLRQGRGIDGAHAGNKEYNKYGIGICLVGDYNNGRPTAKQLSQLRKLCGALMKRYKISRSRVYPHRQVRKGHTDCPGKSFPFRQLIRTL